MLPLQTKQKEKVSIKSLILNFEFAKCEKLLRDRDNERNHKQDLNLGIIKVIRTLITRSETDLNLALIQLKETGNSSNKTFSSITLHIYSSADAFTMKSLRLVDDPRFLHPESEEFSEIYSKRLFSELVSVECDLLRIFLKCLCTGENSNIFTELLNESELTNFRAAFMTLYHAHGRFQALPSEHKLKGNDDDSEYKDGLMLSWGLCNLLSLLLPSQLSTIMGISEFLVSTIAEALNMINYASIASGEGIQCLLANLILVMYYSDMNTKPDEAIKHLTAMKQPKSAMIQYLHAKLLRFQGQTSGALELFAKIRLIPPIIQIPVYWQMVQCFAESQKWPEAVQYTRSLREYDTAGTFPSKILSLYIEAAFMQASTGRIFGPLSFEVQGPLEKILEAARNKNKSPRSLLDSFAISRARNVLERKEHFFLPHFELLLIWDRLECIGHKKFVTSQVRMALESSDQLTFEQQTLGWLILAVLSDSPAASSKLIVNHILPREKALPPASFVGIRAKLELAKYLLHAGNDIEFGWKLLKEIEMNCFDKNGFPGQATILLLLSKLKN